MQEHVVRHFGFFKATLLGGIVFLLPVAVVGWLLAQAAPLVWQAYGVVKGFLADHEDDAIAAYANLSTTTYVLLILGTLVAMLGVCFVAGVVARWSLGRWFSRSAERYLLMLFPRYAVFKDQLTGNLGSASLTPVLAQIGPATRIGMEVERTADGRVTVYLPSSPDPWSGSVAIVAADDITPLDGEFIDVMATFEQLGRGAAKYVPPATEYVPPAS